MTLRPRNGVAELSAVAQATPDLIATATLAIETSGEGLIEFTREARRFVTDAGARDGTLQIFLQHTSASLTIQENADPAVQKDLLTALDRLAPADAGWVHDPEGPDDMPAHVKTMITGVSVHVPVVGGALALGTWQGLYLVEHRVRPHRREIVLQFIGTSR